METRTELRTFEVRYLCDACGIGEMAFQNVALTCNPPQYPHKCNHCGEVVNFAFAYPAIAQELVPTTTKRSLRK